MNQTDPATNASRLAFLLKQAALLKDKIDTLASASGKRFNIFTILDRETDEVKTHSAILADLLNPSGLHGQGAVFARLFLDRLGIESDSDLRRSRVGTEVDTAAHGRIDILFETDNFCIVIENKIYAGDQSGQLERYFSYARTKWADDRIRLLYLTLSGSDPDTDSLGSSVRLQKVTRISYESDIIGWLDACIKEAARIPQIRELLVQYQNLLRKLTGTHDGNLTMVLEKLLTEKQGETYNFELVPALYDALKSMRIEVEWQFWESLRRRLLAGRKESRTWCLEEVPEIDDALRVGKEVIESAHTQGRNRKWKYGWTFRIRPDHELFLPEPSEILLRVEHERESTWSWIFCAFILAERAEGKPVRVKQTRLRRDTFGRTFTNRARELNVGLELKANDWWLGYRYPRRDISFHPETLVTNGLMHRLIENRQAVVDEFALEIEAVVEALVGSSFRTGGSAE